MRSTLLIPCLAVATCCAQSNHATWGIASWNDTLVYSNFIERSSRLLTVIDEDIVFPPEGIVSMNAITSIQAYDNHTNGNGANATILHGGINNDTVTIRLRSQRGYGIRFNVQIYTTPCRPMVP